MRLTEAGRALGLVGDAQWDAFNRKRDAVSRETQRLKSTWVNPQTLPAAAATALLGQPLAHEYSLADLLRRPQVSYAALMAAEQGRFAALEATGPLPPEVAEQVEVSIKYEGYIDRQNEAIDRAAHYESLALPPDLDYAAIKALSFEVRQKLSQHRPETLGQASRVQGVTPAAVSLLLIHLKKGGKLPKAPAEAEAAA
jgi:tRNA uridine 5-carboxymethylaminomethyl modification enzyme